ncbi:cobalt chelatase [Cupriavidus gilardii]|uniref:Cobalt chelatase n=1 Tax=Cupriavidus gilardii TaxID=82541 RepID=A0ABY4VQ87_9BURK|nr:cobalt chelatase [Cupriavidus gilardii]USE78179.1 cobalt chelatase [Cupriavidus gilardii]
MMSTSTSTSAEAADPAAGAIAEPALPPLSAAVQRRREALCAAVLRALAGDAALHYRAGRPWRGQRPLPLHAPHVLTDVGRDAFADLRGGVDGVALRLRHGDADLHRALRPADPVARLLFELFEQLRCETHLPAGMPGVAANLHARFERWSLAFHRSGLTEGRFGILVYTVAQVVWSRLSGRPVVEETEDLIEATRAAIVPALGTALAGMRRTRADQRAFAEHALAAAEMVAGMLRDDARRAGLADDDGREAHESVRDGFSLLLDFEDEALLQEAGGAGTGGARARANEARAPAYAAFTTRYDRELRAATLARQASLQAWRERLDRRIVDGGINPVRIARTLSSAFALPAADGWSSGEEEGRLDRSRLAQLACAGGQPRIFRQPRLQPRTDAVLAFLIDCSGSMKAHIDQIALLVDVMTRAADAAGLATEVLGFTTGAWNGGRVARDWQAAGRPQSPGRLNEVCHLVFKDADTSWRRARTGIAALFKADLFREGIDGEAVDWACARLLSRPQARRLLVVVSDGSPMDRATAQANGERLLDDHLKDVAARHEAQGRIELMGLGVDLDLSPYYRRHFPLDTTRPLDTAAIDAIARWVGSGGCEAQH